MIQWLYIFCSCSGATDQTQTGLLIDIEQDTSSSANYDPKSPSGIFSSDDMFSPVVMARNGPLTDSKYCWWLLSVNSVDFGQEQGGEGFFLDPWNPEKNGSWLVIGVSWLVLSFTTLQEW